MISWQTYNPNINYSWSRIKSAENLTELKTALKGISKSVSTIYVLGSRNALSITRSNPGKVFIGCIGKTRDQWLKMSERWSKGKGYDAKTRKEYEKYVKFLSSIKFE